MASKLPPYSAHFDANQVPSIMGVEGTLGTADTGGTARPLPVGINPTTGALYVEDLSGVTGTTTVRMVSGTLNVGTVVVSSSSGGTNVNVVTGTLLNTGTTVNVATGTQQTLGTVNRLEGGTLSVNMLSGTLNVGTTTVSGNVGISSGTINVGTVNASIVSSNGTITALAVGTVGGKAASGAAAVANPIQIAGTDSGGTIYSPLVTSGGLLAVNINTGTINVGTVVVPTGTITTIAAGTQNTLGTVGTIPGIGTVTNIGSISNIGTMPAVGGGTQFAEDAPHTSGDGGNVLLAVRTDGGTALAADGDYHVLETDANGALRITGTVTTGAGTQAVRLVDGTLTNLATGTLNALASGTITAGTIVRTAPASAAGSLTAAGTVNLLGSNTDAAAINIGGTWVGTGFFEGQTGTSSWFALDAVKQGGVVGSQTTANGDFYLNTAGLSGARFRLTFSSGTLTHNTQTTPFEVQSHYLLGGSVSNLGSVANIGVVHNAGTLAAGANNIGDVDIATGTVTLLSTVTTVSNLTNGSVNLLTGTVTRVSNIGTLESGTVQINPDPVPTMLQFGTLGTAGGSFFATLSAASGAGTKHFVSGVDIVMDSGTADVRVLAGSSIQGTGVLAAGKFPAGGGISKQWPVAFETGTNSELIYHFVGAGTAFITVSYWKGT